MPALALVALVVLWRAPASSILWRALEPLLEVRARFDISEVTRLRAELASTTAVLADRDALYAENLVLKEKLGRTDVALPGILAGVLQRPPWTAYDTLVIDAGTVHGVAVGDLVSAGGNAYIGRVSEAYERTSRVELFSAPGSSHQALLNGEVQMAVEGQGGGSMRAEVPAGTEVQAGDPVLFPGLAGGITAAVSAVDARSGESFIALYMHLPANPSHVRFVEVRKP